MKKITLLIIAVFAITSAKSQIVYNTVFSDNFESSTFSSTSGGGFPSNFSCKGQQIWYNSNATSNPNPYTGNIWKDLYSVAITADKTYTTSIAAENRTGGIGNQCLKFQLTNTGFKDKIGEWDTMTTRIRSNAISGITFNTGAGESITKYEVTFWAKSGDVDRKAFINTQSSTTKTYLTITTTWQKYTIERYVTGTNSNALAIDFVKQDDNSDYVVYFDDITIKERKIAYTSAATNITTSGFTANWAAVVGATSYSLVVEKSDGATPATWTAISGSPFSVGNATNYALTGLDAAATYRYRVTATDGTITTVESNNTSATTNSATGVATIKIKSAYAANGNIYVDLNEAQEVEVFNTNGQRVASHKGITGVNTIAINKAGLYIVKSAGEIKKIILN